MALTKVGPKFQVTLPKVTREAIGLNVGDLVEATPTKNGVLLRPQTVVDNHPEIDKRLAEGSVSAHCRYATAFHGQSPSGFNALHKH
jgi:AbrB family looped-hinge helix DNA binding protein